MTKTGRSFVIVLVLILAALGIAGALTLAARRAEFRTLERDTLANAMPSVTVIHPSSVAAGEGLVLPSTLEAYVNAPIYARTSGYLKKWYFDLGSRVKEGDLLAELDTPETDQELAQVRAARQQLAANVDLARSTAERWEGLRKSEAVSQQEVDEKKSAYAQLQASLAAADANIKRLEGLQGYRRIYAPFAGVITKRNVDTGTLVNAGNGGSAQQLFHLSQTDPIRAFVSVPEAAAPAIHRGLAATLELTQLPGVKFAGQVARTSESIDPATRTLLTEVDVPNPDGRLLPGGYAQVRLQVKTATARLQVPVNALLFRAEGLRAAVVDANNRVHLTAITIGRDFGSTLEVLQGLSADDWIVLNPSDSLDEGQIVRVEKPAVKK